MIRGEPRDVLVTSHLSCLEVESVAARAFNADADEGGRPRAAYALRPADAVHFATAGEARSFAGADVFVFVGSDRELLSACEASGIDVLDPEAETRCKSCASTGQGSKESQRARSGHSRSCCTGRALTKTEELRESRSERT